MKLKASFLVIVISVACLAMQPASEPRKLSEAEHAEALAEKYGAALEVVQWDKTRIDFVTDDYVIEIDFAYKWAEAIGQALYYAIADPSDRLPAIVLLVDKGQDRFAHRCQAVCAAHGIKLFVERVQFHD